MVFLNQVFSYDRLSEVMDKARLIRNEALRLGAMPISFVDGFVVYSVAFTVFSNTSSRGIGVDLGAGTGFSTLWIAAGMEDACKGRYCRLIAVEVDEARAKSVKAIKDALRLKNVYLEIRVMDAVAFLEEVSDNSLDLVFVDVSKQLYPRILELLESKLRVNGVALFHNAYYPMPPRSFFKKLGRGKWITGIVPTDAGIIVARLSKSDSA